MRIAVTGADGLVGRHLVRVGRDAGHDVVALTRRGGPGTVATGDLAAPNAARRALDACGDLDALVHVAWATEPASYLHARENLTSLDAAMAVFAAAADAGVPQVVGVGTCLELGETDAVRLPEDRVAPGSLYAACKVAAHTVGRSLVTRSGGRFAWARVFHLLAPDADPRWIVPHVVREVARGRRVALTDGAQRRDYTHVDDVASALVRVAERGGDGVFHVCTGEPTTFADLLRGLVGDAGAALLGFGDRPRPEGEAEAILGDPRSLRALGWRPRDRAVAVREVGAALRTRADAGEVP